MQVQMLRRSTKRNDSKLKSADIGAWAAGGRNSGHPIMIMEAYEFLGRVATTHSALLLSYVCAREVQSLGRGRYLTF